MTGGRQESEPRLWPPVEQEETEATAGVGSLAESFVSEPPRRVGARGLQIPLEAACPHAARIVVKNSVLHPDPPLPLWPPVQQKETEATERVGSIAESFVSEPPCRVGARGLQGSNCRPRVSTRRASPYRVLSDIQTH